MKTTRTILVATALVAATLIGAGVTAVASQEGPGNPPDRGSLPVGARFITALAERDFSTAQALLAPGVEFKALTPSQGFIDLTGPDAVMTLLREWYATATALENLEADEVLERHHVGYRIRWESADDGPFVFEQQAYYDLDDDSRIRRLHLVCSGDQPVSS